MRRSDRDIAGQTQLFSKKDSWDKAFATYSHFMRNVREKMTQKKSPPLERAEEIAILGRHQRVYSVCTE